MGLNAIHRQCGAGPVPSVTWGSLEWRAWHVQCEIRAWTQWELDELTGQGLPFSWHSHSSGKRQLKPVKNEEKVCLDGEIAMKSQQNFRFSLKLVTLGLEKPARFKVDSSFSSLWKHCLNLIPWPFLGQSTSYKAFLFHPLLPWGCWWLSGRSGLVSRHPRSPFKTPFTLIIDSVILPELCCFTSLGF